MELHEIFDKIKSHIASGETSLEKLLHDVSPAQRQVQFTYFLFKVDVLNVPSAEVKMEGDNVIFSGKDLVLGESNDVAITITFSGDPENITCSCLLSSENEMMAGSLDHLYKTISSEYPELPVGLAQIGQNRLKILKTYYNENTKNFTLKANGVAQWKFARLPDPFEPKIEITIEQEDNIFNKNDFKLKIAEYKLVDFIQLKGVDINYNSNADAQWKADGKAQLQLFDGLCTLKIGYNNDAKHLVLNMPKEERLANLGEGLVTLSADQFDLIFNSADEEVEWTLQGRASVTITPFPEFDPVRITGGFEFYKEEDDIGLKLTAETNLMKLVLLNTPRIELLLASSILFFKYNTETKKVELGSSSILQLTGIPILGVPKNAPVIPDRLEVSLAVKNDPWRLELALVKPWVYANSLPDLNLMVQNQPVKIELSKLGKSAFGITKIVAKLSKEPSLSLTVGFGLPENLNHIFSPDDPDNAPKFFKTYADKEHTVDFEIGIGKVKKEEDDDDPGTEDSKYGAFFKMTSSPVYIIDFKDPWWILDFKFPEPIGDFGAVKFKSPTFKYTGEKFKMDIHAKVERDLGLPLNLIKNLLKRLDLEEAGKLLPDRITLQDLELLDGNNNLDVKKIIDTLKLPKDPFEEVLTQIAKRTDRLPNAFKKYFRIQVPKEIEFSIEIKKDASISLDLSFGEDEIRMLAMPVQIPPPPIINGIVFRGISIGTLLGGKLLKVEIDCDFEVFDLPSLLLSVLLPETGIRPVENFHTRLVVNKLMLVIIPFKIPIVVPLFYDRLAIEYLGIHGIEVQGNIKFEKLNFNFMELILMISQLVQFFIDPDHRLPGGIHMKELSAGGENNIWTTDVDDNVYKLESGSWSRKKDAKMRQLSAGMDGSTWATDEKNLIYRRKRNAGEWEKITGQKLLQVACQDHDTAYGIDSKGKLFQFTSPGTSWKRVGENGWTPIETSGGLVQISVAKDGTVWGIAADNDIWRFHNDTWTKPISSSWRRVDGLEHDSALGVNNINDTFHYKDGQNNSLNSKMFQLVGYSNQDIYGLNESGSAYTYQPGNPPADKWKLLVDPKNGIPQDLNLRFVMEKCFIEMPKYLLPEGVDELVLGSKKVIIDISLLEIAFAVMNSIKFLSVDNMIRLVPFEHRVGIGEFAFEGFDFRAQWLITSPKEFAYGAYHRIKIPPKDVDNWLDLLGDVKSGGVLFLQGHVKFGDFALLHAHFGMLIAGVQGFNINFRFEGYVKEIIHARLAGKLEIKLDNQGQSSRFEVNGDGLLKFGPFELFTGKIRAVGNKDGFFIKGKYKLQPLPELEWLSIHGTGEIDAVINNQGVKALGNANMNLGPIVLADAKLDVLANATEGRVKVNAFFLGSVVDFNLEYDEQKFLLDFDAKSGEVFNLKANVWVDKSKEIGEGTLRGHLLKNMFQIHANASVVDDIGKGELKIFHYEREMVTGTIHSHAGRIDLKGSFDLLPKNQFLSLTGDIKGHISKEEVDIQAQSALTSKLFGGGLANGKLSVTNDGLLLSFNILTLATGETKVIKSGNNFEIPLSINLLGSKLTTHLTVQEDGTGGTADISYKFPDGANPPVVELGAKLALKPDRITGTMNNFKVVGLALFPIPETSITIGQDLFGIRAKLDWGLLTFKAMANLKGEINKGGLTMDGKAKVTLIKGIEANGTFDLTSKGLTGDFTGPFHMAVAASFRMWSRADSSDPDVPCFMYAFRLGIFGNDRWFSAVQQNGHVPIFMGARQTWGDDTNFGWPEDLRPGGEKMATEKFTEDYEPLPLLDIVKEFLQTDWEQPQAPERHIEGLSSIVQLKRIAASIGGYNFMLQEVGPPEDYKAMISLRNDRPDDGFFTEVYNDLQSSGVLSAAMTGIKEQGAEIHFIASYAEAMEEKALFKIYFEHEGDRIEAETIYDFNSIESSYYSLAQKISDKD